MQPSWTTFKNEAQPSWTTNENESQPSWTTNDKMKYSLHERPMIKWSTTFMNDQ